MEALCGVLVVLFGVSMLTTIVDNARNGNRGERVSATFMLGPIIVGVGLLVFGFGGRELSYNNNVTIGELMGAGAALGFGAMFAVGLPFAFVVAFMSGVMMRPKQRKLGEVEDSYGNRWSVSQRYMSAGQVKQQGTLRRGCWGTFGYMMWLVPFGAVFGLSVFITKDRAIDPTSEASMLYLVLALGLFYLLQIPAAMRPRG